MSARVWLYLLVGWCHDDVAGVVGRGGELHWWWWVHGGCDVIKSSAKR